MCRYEFQLFPFPSLQKPERILCSCILSSLFILPHVSSGGVWCKHHWPDLFKHYHNKHFLWKDSILALLTCSQVTSAGNWAVIWPPAQLCARLLSLFAGLQDEVWLAGGLFPPSNLPPPLMTLFFLDSVLSCSCWGGLHDFVSETFP